MTPAEYIQLKAFARVDGAMLAVLWVASFVCCIVGLRTPLYSMVALGLMVATPFFVGRRLMKFRDFGLGGIISFARGWGYSVYVFFYAAVLLALAQYVYFAYIDQGYMVQTFSKLLASPEARQLAQQYGIQETLKEGLEQFGQMRPIDYALNVLTVNIMAGMLLGMPIAAMLQRRSVEG